MEQLLTILNDSTNYRWGELGTPEVHYYFTFHDHNDNIIGSPPLMWKVWLTPTLRFTG
jgi:hypothetical protein